MRPRVLGECPLSNRLRQLFRLEPLGQPPSRQTQVEIGEKQALASVRMPTKQRSVWVRNGRSGRGTNTRVVHASEVAGILGSPAENGFLVKRILRIAETGRDIAAWFGPMKVGMKHNMRTMDSRSANGLGISPTFVANRNSELERSGLKNAPSRPRYIKAVFRRIDLHFVLEARYRSIRIDHQRSGE